MDKFYEKWKANYDLAKEYYKIYGTINVGRNVEYKGCKLGQWVATQRSVLSGARKGRLTNRQIHMLESLGIEWWSENSKSKINTRARSKEFMKSAERFYEENGNLLVPASYMDGDLALGKWISTLRTTYRNVPIDVLENNPQDIGKYLPNSRLSIENIIALNDMNMLWKENSMKNWDYKYSLAREYFQRTGNLRIHNNYIANDENGTHLGEWVQYNRQLYAHNKLSMDRVEKLEQIGMIWNVWETIWDEKYSIAKEYFEEYGNLRVAQNTIYHNCNLGAWVDWQRQAKKGNVRNSLSERRIDLLNSIGMVWYVYTPENEKVS